MSTGQWTESSPASVSLPEGSSWDRFTTAIRMNPASTLLATSCLALFVTSYWSTLSSLVHRWNTDPNYSHGYFVPLVSLYLFYQSIERRSPSFPAVRGGSWIGSTLLIVAIAMLWLTTLLPSLIIESASMLLALLGGVYLVWGRSIGHLAIARRRLSRHVEDEGREGRDFSDQTGRFAGKHALGGRGCRSPSSHLTHSSPLARRPFIPTPGTG